MLIALAGLPSAGKTTTAKALANLFHVRAFVEPEEDRWPDAVRERERVGRFTALSWFRSARVPLLFAAAQASRDDGAAVFDSYYDVLLHSYIDEDAFAWLLGRDDPYFPVARSMAELDWERLPRADVLVFLRLDEECWRTFMVRRGRDFDRSAGLADYFAMQSAMERACRRAADEHGTRLIIVDQRDASPDETAGEIARLVRALPA